MGVYMKKLYFVLFVFLLLVSILIGCLEMNVNGKKDGEFYLSEDEVFENVKKEFIGI